MNSKIFILLIVLFYSNISLFSQNINSEKLNDYINSIENNNLDIGTISIFKDGKEVFHRDFNKSKNQNQNSDFIYQIGSVTKLFTATLIFKLIEKNKLSLETKLNKYYPDVKNSNLINIRNLLEHSSGLNNFVKKDENIVWLKEARTENEIINEIVSQQILFSPNDSVSYSNSGYFLLGKIVEKVYKKKYSSVLKKEITKPFNLENINSAFSNPKNISESYNFENKSWKKVNDFHFKNIIGVGDISSTAKDLNVFINLLFNDRILNAKFLAIMKPITEKEVYGRGLMTFNFHNMNFYGNTGGTYGTNSILIYDEINKISIALIINGERYPRNEFIGDIVNLIYNEKIDFAK